MPNSDGACKEEEEEEEEEDVRYIQMEYNVGDAVDESQHIKLLAEYNKRSTVPFWKRLLGVKPKLSTDDYNQADDQLAQSVLDEMDLPEQEKKRLIVLNRNARLTPKNNQG